jgi:hypothetical protein
MRVLNVLREQAVHGSEKATKGCRYQLQRGVRLGVSNMPGEKVKELCENSVQPESRVPIFHGCTF